jgi:hypothetical protein
MIKILSFLFFFIFFSVKVIDSKSPAVVVYKHKACIEKICMTVITSPGCEHCLSYHHEHLTPFIEWLKKSPYAKNISVRLIPFFADPFSLEVLKACCVMRKKYFWTLFDVFQQKQKQWRFIDLTKYKTDEEAWEAFQKNLIKIIQKKYSHLTTDMIYRCFDDQKLEEEWFDHHEHVSKMNITALPFVFIKISGKKSDICSSPPSFTDLKKKIQALMP